MPIHRDQPAVRICGTLLGIGFLVLGFYAMFGAGEEVSEFAKDRAFWFGVCASVAGLGAVIASVGVKRLDNIWCAPPRRGLLRATGDDSRTKS